MRAVRVVALMLVMLAAWVSHGSAAVPTELPGGFAYRLTAQYVAGSGQHELLVSWDEPARRIGGVYTGDMLALSYGLRRPVLGQLDATLDVRPGLRLGDHPALTAELAAGLELNGPDWQIVVRGVQPLDGRRAYVAAGIGFAVSYGHPWGLTQAPPPVPSSLQDWRPFH